MGVSIDKRVRELGAHQFYPLGKADEATGLEEVVEPWMAELWQTLGIGSDATIPTSRTEPDAPVAAPITAPTDTMDISKYASIIGGIISYEAMFGDDAIPAEDPIDVPRFPEPSLTTTPVEEKVAPQRRLTGEFGRSRGNPFPAQILDAKYLTAPEWTERQVLQIELDLTGSGIDYTPGDAVGIICPNPSTLVELMVERLGVSKSQSFTIENNQATPQRRQRTTTAGSQWPSPCSMEYAFTHCVDLTSIPRKAVIRALAHYCTRETEKRSLLRLASKSGASMYKVGRTT